MSVETIAIALAFLAALVGGGAFVLRPRTRKPPEPPRHVQGAQEAAEKRAVDNLNTDARRIHEDAARVASDDPLEMARCAAELDG